MTTEPILGWVRRPLVGESARRLRVGPFLMRDWAVCTIGTTARLEIDRFENPCAFEPFYGSECRLIPTIRRDLAAAKTATPGGWPHLRIGNLWSEHFPGTFCIVANDRSWIPMNLQTRHRAISNGRGPSMPSAPRWTPPFLTRLLASCQRRIVLPQFHRLPKLGTQIHPRDSQEPGSE